MQHADEGRHHKNHAGIQMGQPGYDDARPAHIIGDGGGQQTGGAHLEGGSQTDEGGGEEDSAQDDGVDLHTGIVGAACAVAHHGDLIAVLGVLQVHVDQYADDQGEGDTDVQAELARHGDGGEGDDFCEAGKDGTHRLGVQEEVPVGLGLADVDEDIQGYIVEHQGHQSFVGAELYLQSGYKQAVQTGGEHGSQTHQQQGDHAGEDGACLEGHEGGRDSAQNELAFAADVPEAHLKGQRQGHGGEGQRNEVLQIVDPHLIGNLVAHSTHGEHTGVVGHRVHTQSAEEYPAHKQRDDHSGQIEAAFFPQGTVVPFYNMKAHAQPSSS